MFGDEASFWLDGTLHQTWAKIGVQPRVDTFGMRKTAHVFGAISLEARPRFHYDFAPVFNGRTFRLPPYSPELNPIEGVWKQTKKRTTHNTFYRTTDERDAALRSTFNDFRKLPSTIARQVARFL